MKTKYFKVIVVTIIVMTMGCVLTYAEKSKDKKDCKISLPAAVTEAISSLYPGSVVKNADMDEEETKVYEVEIKPNGPEIEMTIAPDGTMLEVTTEMDINNLPPAVARAITDASGGASIKEVKNEVTYAVIKIVKLDKPSANYEVELVKDSMKSEIKVSADGKVLEQPNWKAKHNDKDDDEDNDEEKDDD